jgi:hypothetical protein
MTYLMWLCSLNGVSPRVVSFYTSFFMDLLYVRFWGRLYYIRRVCERSYYGEVDL